MLEQNAHQHGYATREISEFLRGSRHTPLPERAVRDAMRTLCELMKEEENAIVRAILGHFVFVYIHPYMDGNGRTARFKNDHCGQIVSRVSPSNGSKIVPIKLDGIL